MLYFLAFLGVLCAPLVLWHVCAPFLGSVERKGLKVAKTEGFKSSDLELAFELGDKRFYHYKNDLNMPYSRVMAIVDFTREYDMRIDREHLEVLLASVLGLINTGNTTDIVRLVSEAQKRLGHITHLGLMYKIAACSYLEEGEPEEFDLQIASKKIEFWQANQKDVDAFFLAMPIGVCIPFLNTYKESLASYSQMTMQELNEIYSVHSSILSSLPNAEELTKKLNSLVEQNSVLMQLVS
jgi:hypothetical protein